MRTADRQLKRDAKRVARSRKATKQNATEPESKKEPPAAKVNTKTICIMHGGGKRGLKPGRPPKKRNLSPTSAQKNAWPESLQLATKVNPSRLDGRLSPGHGNAPPPASRRQPQIWSSAQTQRAATTMAQSSLMDMATIWMSMQPAEPRVKRPRDLLLPLHINLARRLANCQHCAEHHWRACSD
jgi:hypothetical protein